MRSGLGLIDHVLTRTIQLYLGRPYHFYGFGASLKDSAALPTESSNLKLLETAFEASAAAAEALSLEFVHPGRSTHINSQCFQRCGRTGEKRKEVKRRERGGEREGGRERERGGGRTERGREGGREGERGEAGRERERERQAETGR